MSKDSIAYHCEDCPPELMAECLRQANAIVAEARALGNGPERDYTDETVYAVRSVCLRVQQEQQGMRRSLRERLKRESPSAPEESQPSPARGQPEAATIPDTAPRSLILVVPDTQHRIALPAQGRIILGRVDLPNLLSPDVDLTFDDRYNTISRYHATVTGVGGGKYEIADLDSQHGTWVNGVRLAPHHGVALALGDEVRLGNCQLLVVEAPEVWNAPPCSGPFQYFLYSTFTGHVFALPCNKELLVGRSDQRRGIYPDIDLSQEGEAAYGVSRRHATITCSEDGFYVTDLQSSNGTRIDGVPLTPHEPTLVRPGQHIWLGGLVLYLDVME